MSVAVVSGIFGNYDQPKQQPEVEGVDQWVMVTDDPSLEAPGWQIVRVCQLAKGMHPRLAAKLPKFMPWLFTQLDSSIWLDGSATISNPDGFVDWALGDAPLSLYIHPERDNNRDEAEVSLHHAKYSGLPVREQVVSYGQVAGLWASGFIARQHNNEKVRELGWRWFEECSKWTYQDQLSLPYLLNKLGIKPRALEGELWDGRRLRFTAHRTDL